MARVPKVKAWSNTVRASTFDPADVDLFVLRDCPDVLEALGRRRADTETAATSRRERAEGALLVTLIAPLLSLAAFGGPVPGRSGLVAGPMDEEVAVVWTALCFLVALPAPVVLAPVVLARWRRAHRRRAWWEVACLALVALVGARVLGSMTADWYVAPLGVPTWPVWVTTLGAAVVLGAMLVASTGRRSQGDTCFRVVGPPVPARVRAAVAALPPRSHEQLLDMRIRAVERLRGRGLLGAEQARALTSAPLGEGPLARASGRQRPGRKTISSDWK